jgi:Iap family predicted aminopeptidase
MTDEQKELEKKLLDTISVEEATKHVRWLADRALEALAANRPPRISGTPEAEAATMYIVEQLKNYGVDHELYRFKSWLSIPKNNFDTDGVLKVISPEEKTIPCVVYAACTPTPPEGIEAELVDAGGGYPDDYKKLDIKGKMSLADVTQYEPGGMSRHETCYFAEKAGAIANIQVWIRDEKYRGQVKRVWGSPAPEMMDEMPHIPSVSVSKGDGEYLRSLCAKGPVKVHLKVDIINGWMDALEPVAEAKGTEEPEKFFLFGGHQDAWGGGVTCNAVGIAMMIEFARALTKVPQKRSVRVGWWMGHETSAMGGSQWYCDNYWDDIQQNCLAHVNTDSQGMIDQLSFTNPSSPEIRKLIEDVVKEVEGYTVPHSYPGKGGDYPSFYQTGIPTSALRMRMPPGRASIGEWIHTDDDNFDKFDPENWMKHARVQAIIISSICNYPVLPY